MRKMLLSLALCLAAPAFSVSQSIGFYNQESGLALDFPEGFKHSWNVRNFDIGLEINVFQEKSGMFNEGRFAVIAQIPLDRANCFDEIEFLSTILGEFDDFPAGMIVYIEKEEIIFQTMEMPIIGVNENAKRMRVYASLDEIGEKVIADIQFFVQDHHAFMILTGIQSKIEEEVNEDLEVFTKQVFQSIRFTQ